MKKNVFIKYNPYKLETEVTVNGKPVAPNSRLHPKDGTRLQEWVDDLPQALVDELNTKEIEITFHGTRLDYEDVKKVFEATDEEIRFEEAKEVSDKTRQIESIFKEIQKGPFGELRSGDIINAFKQVKNNEFEVCVVATMSAGKSTLINSMLGTPLMPSKGQACTAIITRIKDNDADGWKAQVFDENGTIIETRPNISRKDMDRLNADEKVSSIEIQGNIPFVSASETETALVLVDTPGPDNARDPRHGIKQWGYLENSSKALVLFIMESTFEKNDNDALLEKIAASVKVRGKESRDRFIFVVNKMDNWDSQDGPMESIYQEVQNYLEDHDIHDPNLFFAAARPALNIRLVQNGATDKEICKSAKRAIEDLNEEENMHFEKFSALPSNARKRIGERLTQAKNAEDAAAEALIHTGVPSVEAAVRQYVEKYAKPAKIKALVDTFQHRLEEMKATENLKKEISENTEKAQKISKLIDKIQNEINNGKSAAEFTSSISSIAKASRSETKTAINETVKKFQAKLTNKLENTTGNLSRQGAKRFINELEHFAKMLQPEFQSSIDTILKKSLIETSEELLNQYKEKIKSLSSDLGGKTDISIAPLTLISGELPTADEIDIDDYLQKEQVKVGERYVENENKKWYKFWTWFEEDGHYEDVFEEREFIDSYDLAYSYMPMVEQSFLKVKEETLDYTEKQSNAIVKYFTEQFKRLDELLQKKLNELKEYAAEQKNLESKRIECGKKLKWLEEISDKIESILEI